MDGKPTYEELRQRVEELEKQSVLRTEEKKALMESEEKFKSLAEQSPNMIFINKKGRVVYVNKLCEEVTGYKREEICSEDFDFLTLIAQESIELVKTSLGRHLRGEEVEPYEYGLVTKTGKRIDAIITTKLIDYEGERATLGIVTDITARKRAEEALRESEKKYKTLTESSLTGIYIIQNNKFVFVNKRFADMHGYSVEEMVGHEYLKFMHPEEKERIEQYVSKRLGGGDVPKHYELRLLKKDGKTIWCEIMATVTQYNGRPAIVGNLFDITERKQGEEALRQSEARYRLIVEYAPTAIYEFDSINRRLVKVNDVMCQILGYTEEELLSMDPMFLFTEESRQLALERLGKILAGEEVPDTVEYKVKRKDGSELWALVNTRFFYEEGEPVSGISIAQDISERKRLEEQLFQAQKMKALGTMASGVAHNFRNVLAVISMQSQIAQMKYGDDSEFQDIAERVNTYVERGAQLVDGLMQFSRRQTKKEYQPINLAEVIRETYQLISISFDKKITIRTKVPETLTVIGDHSELSRVLMNLYANARDAMPEGGELRIGARKKGGKALVAVSDTGCGMDGETQERCFDPFFTTKEIIKGTGLGLSTAYGIVEEHGGEIQVLSKVGRGSTFKLYFPLAPAGEQEEQESLTQKISGKGQKILIVDDETDMCKLMQDLLDAFGYQAASVNSGKAAIMKYESWRPDAVLLDRNMPEMDGLTCAEKIMDHDPNAKILIMSGYDEDERSGMVEDKKKLFRGYLTKPINMNKLSTYLSQLLK
jgi:PAS domain S-box-containing protein